MLFGIENNVGSSNNISEKKKSEPLCSPAESELVNQDNFNVKASSFNNPQ